MQVKFGVTELRVCARISTSSSVLMLLAHLNDIPIKYVLRYYFVVFSQLLCKGRLVKRYTCLFQDMDHGEGPSE